MNPFKVLVIASAVSLSTTFANAQVCENGICRLSPPSQNVPGQNIPGRNAVGAAATGRNMFDNGYTGNRLQSQSTYGNASPAELWLRQNSAGQTSLRQSSFGQNSSPAWNGPANNRDLRNIPANYDPFRQPDTINRRSGYSPTGVAACTACDCRGGYCDCGPNCPTHYESSNRFQESLRAPNPVNNRYQAANYTPSIPWLSNYETALAESRRTGRPVLVKVGATWCGACKQLKSETLTDAGVIRSISTSFIPVDIDADVDRKLIEQMGVRSLPSLLVITPDLRIVEKIEGFITPQQLSASLLRHMQRAQLDTDIKVASR